MKRRVLIAGAAILIVAVVIALVYVLVVPPAVDVAEVESRDVVDTLVATGEVVPVDNPTLTAPVAAPVAAVEVDTGDRVEPGDVIARLDPSEAEHDLERARATVAEARAGLSAVVDRTAPTALEDVEEAQRAIETAREEYERARQLYEAGVGPRIDVEEAQRAIDQAQSQLDRATTAYEGTHETGSDYEQAAAAVARAEAEYRLARSRLDDYTIRAPFEATVRSVQVDPGASLQPGGAVATITAEGAREIRIEPDERELAALRAGQRAIAATDAYPDQHFDAVVHRIAPAVDPERGTVAVDLQIEDPPDFLRSSMTVTVDIELDRRDDALIVPRPAVRELDDEPFVMQIDDRRARRIPVDVGADDTQFVEITDGLEVGDTVIADPDVEPDDRVRPGDNITPDPGEPTPFEPIEERPDIEPPRAENPGGSS